MSLLLYPTDRAAYARLSKLISLGRRRAPKAACWLTLADVLANAEGLVAALLPETLPEALPKTLPEPSDTDALISLLAQAFADRLYLTAIPRFDGRNTIARIAWTARQHGLPLLASAAPLMHIRSRKPLADVAVFHD